MLTFVTAIVRAWTWLYTAGLDPDPRDDRRAQIESDIWDYQDDAQVRGLSDLLMAAQMLARLALGIPDDLLWRGEQLSAPASVVAVTLGEARSEPVTFRRLSGFGVSATVHAVAVMLVVWAAPKLTSVDPPWTASVRTTTIVFAPEVPSAPPSDSRDLTSAAVVPDDNLGIKLGAAGSTLSMPGFEFNFSKVITRAGGLFPFVTGNTALERIAATAMLPRPRKGLISPLAGGAADSGNLPPLVLNNDELQALVDRTWARRDRWDAFAKVVPLAEGHNANVGALPELLRAYVEQNGLQPYVDGERHDPRLWTQLGVVADHAEFIDFISRYLAFHASTRTGTELLFLLDTLVQGSYDTLTALLDVIPDVDLYWTHSANAGAYDAMVTMQKHYRAELERRNLTTRASLRLYFDAARISILTNLLATTPGDYRANDARFLIGAIYWRQGREAAALAAWSDLRVVQSDRYGDASAAIADALHARTGPFVDSVRINRVLDAERGRWISFSHDRLSHFGYRFNLF